MPRLVHPLLKVVLASTLVAAALVGAGVHARPAEAATPCWKLLLNDWYDGRIDQTYPVHCYREALKHLPSDVQTYSSAHDDILRALQSAIAKEKKQHKEVSSNTPVPPGSAGVSSGTDKGGSNGGSGANEPGRDSGAGLASQVSSDSPSSVPTPLIILGVLALLLVAGGAAGLIAKRIQARRQGL
jgi:cobalamin biosynthesis Mg chelatase CobN